MASDVNEIVLTTGPLGGLGDHLLYSTLPERFTRLGYRVYLDRDNITRNPETFDLIWAKNPYIIGTSDKKPNAGYVNQGRYYDMANQLPMGSIEAMERAHGLPAPYSLAPRIYYEPQAFSVDLRESILVDFSAISSSIAPQGISEHLVKANDRWTGRQFYQVTFPGGVIREAPPINGPSIRVNSIYEYADALASCRGLLCSEAGGQALASAIRGERDVYDLAARPEIMCVISPKTHNSRGYTFRGVDYRVTKYGNLDGDYWDPTEVRQGRYEMMCRRTVEDARNAFIAARLTEQSSA